jgi:hypothetical protein
MQLLTSKMLKSVERSKIIVYIFLCVYYLFNNKRAVALRFRLIMRMLCKKERMLVTRFVIYLISKSG